MTDESISLIPPDHEQSLPTYHVHRAQAEKFINYLHERGITIVEPEQDLGKLGSAQSDIVQIEVDDSHDIELLESVRDGFVRGS